jgi:hypothetical protein
MPRKKKVVLPPTPEETFKQPEAPPPPLFLGQKERDLVKQVNDELIERVIGQAIVYYPISRELTKYHPIYGEALNKTFLSPIKINALVEWGGSATATETFGVDRRTSIVIKFHRRRLLEDQEIYVREGDFVYFGDTYYEIVSLNESKLLFGNGSDKFEILAKCVKARENIFNAK